MTLGLLGPGLVHMTNPKTGGRCRRVRYFECGAPSDSKGLAADNDHVFWNAFRSFCHLSKQRFPDQNPKGRLCYSRSTQLRNLESRTCFFYCTHGSGLDSIHEIFFCGEALHKRPAATVSRQNRKCDGPSGPCKS